MSNTLFDRVYNPEVWETTEYDDEHTDKVLKSEAQNYDIFLIEGKSDSNKITEDMYYLGKKRKHFTIEY
jgi:hypothetical protein